MMHHLLLDILQISWNIFKYQEKRELLAADRYVFNFHIKVKSILSLFVLVIPWLRVQLAINFTSDN